MPRCCSELTVAVVVVALLRASGASALRHGNSSCEGCVRVLASPLPFQQAGWPWLVPRTEQPAIFHMHISKAAGCSFHEDLIPFVPSGIGFWTMEAVLSQIVSDPDFRPHDRIITMLRKPVAHVYSQYLECADDDDWPGKIVPQAKDMTYLLDNMSIWLDHFTGNNFSDEDLGCYNPYNMQSRAFVASKELHHQIETREPTHILAKRAIENMQELWFVGIVEYYQESLCLLHVRLARSLPRWCDCKSPEFDKFKQHENTHHVRKHAVSDLAHEEIERIDRLTEADQKLYERALARFERDVFKAEAEYGVQIMC